MIDLVQDLRRTRDAKTLEIQSIRAFLARVRSREITVKARALSKILNDPAHRATIDLVTISQGWRDLVRFTIHLVGDAADTGLVRDLAKTFGVFRKMRGWDETTLDAECESGALVIRIKGYRPDTCRLVEEQVVVPAQPEYVVIRQRLVCGEEELS